jgi:hypothetical protein
VAAAGTWYAARGPSHGLRRLPRILLALGFLAVVGATGLLGQVFVVVFVGTTALASRSLTSSLVHLLIGWLVLFLMTPFYHPYSRLWLPVTAFGWTLTGGAFAMILERSDPPGSRPAAAAARPPRDPVVALGILCVFVFFFGMARSDVSTSQRISAMLGPSDSLRLACRGLARELPRDVGNLRLYARPPVTFYLSDRVPVSPQPDLEHLLAPGDSRTWALLDMAMLPQSGAGARPAGLDERWTVVREVGTTLNLATLLDIDPAAATDGAGDPSAPLLLLRPKLPGGKP